MSANLLERRNRSSKSPMAASGSSYSLRRGTVPRSRRILVAVLMASLVTILLDAMIFQPVMMIRSLAPRRQPNRSVLLSVNNREFEKRTHASWESESSSSVMKRKQQHGYHDDYHDDNGEDYHDDDDHDNNDDDDYHDDKGGGGDDDVCRPGTNLRSGTSSIRKSGFAGFTNIPFQQMSNSRTVRKRLGVVRGNRGNLCKHAADEVMQRSLRRGREDLPTQLIQDGTWPIASSILPNFYTTRLNDDNNDDYEKKRKVYGSALVAMVNSQKAGSTTLRSIMRDMCSISKRYTKNSNAPNMRRPFSVTQCVQEEEKENDTQFHHDSKTGGCCAGIANEQDWAARACRMFIGDRILASSATCGKNYRMCSRCYPAAITSRTSPPPIVAFHMFREPVERMVSAFKYCTSGKVGDPLCGRYSKVYPKENQTSTAGNLLLFAEYWGSYEARRLLDNPFVSKECNFNHASCVRSRRKQQRPTTDDGNGTTTTTALLSDLVTRDAGLETQFSLIGILDEMDLSLELLSDVTRLPFSALGGSEIKKNAYKARGEDSKSTNTNRSKSDAAASALVVEMDAILSKEQLSAFAGEHPQILSHLGDDIALYEEVKKVFWRQVETMKKQQQQQQHDSMDDELQDRVKLVRDAVDKRSRRTKEEEGAPPKRRRQKKSGAAETS
ncbi:hypothetical protein PPROV_000061800 [Pycnococcus provasolii]|uniref:Sulfotransferase n=1 Tax=Pycnococcus provasolii TaxID=41880 RepID=A0A830H869_9CHLO|nr:hypothetical protein PPROV_000061800 [Pycnococcus provasolii]